ncbi:MAG: hypothetical protein H6657_10280 [Ardenticatenaceae bacterium]|nr:hypothetical protein [Anaerolineales bacterium]MCB8977798.1 hypothetical protein [Ardenticatenaceae bacterium]
MNKTFATIHKVLAFYIGLGVFAQMFFAGIWHAGVVNTPDAHVFFGLSLLLAALLALIAAAVAKLPKAVIGRTALLFFLILLQPILIEGRRNGLPFISAFHALNAPFIGIVSGTVLAMARNAQAGESRGSGVSVATGD